MVLGVLTARAFDPDAIWDQLQQAIQDRSGLELSAEDLHAGLFPRPWLRLEGLELDPQGATTDQPLLSAASLRLRLRLLPLLAGEVELAGLDIASPRLHLVRDSEGHGNWEPLLLRGAGDQDRTDLAWPLHSLHLVDGRVSYVEEASGLRLQLQELTLRLGQLQGRQPGELRASALLTAKQPELQAEINISGGLRADETLEHWQIEELELETHLSLVERDLDARLLLEAQGSFDRSESLLVLPTTQLQAWLEGPELPQGALELTAGAALRVEAAEQRLSAEELTLDALGTQLAGTLELTAGAHGPTVSGSLAAPELNLRQLLARLGKAPALADPGALSRCSAAVDFSSTGSQLTLSRLALGLDGSTLRGDASLHSLSPPAGRFNLHWDLLDLDHWATLDDPEQAGSETGRAASAYLQGELRIDRLQRGGLLLEQVLLPLQVDAEQIRISPVEARLYDGSVRFDLQLAPTSWSLSGGLEQVDLSSLLPALESERAITGGLDLSADLDGAGSSRAQLAQSLAGRLDLLLRDGSLPLDRSRRVEPSQGEGDERRRLRKRTGRVAQRVMDRADGESGDEQRDSLPFHRFELSMQFDEGEIIIDRLSLVSDELRIDGAGTVDLLAQTLELALLLEIRDLPAMELRVTGSLDDPQVKLVQLGHLGGFREQLQVRREELLAARDERRLLLLGQGEELRDKARERGGVVADGLMDHRGRAVDRRQDRREQIREQGEELRDRAQDRREQRRDKARELLKTRQGEDEDEPGTAEEPGEQPSTVGGD